MNKKNFKSFCLVFVFFMTSVIISAQDFTVKVPSTALYGGLIKPLKAGSSLQFQINVKNNRHDTCTVSIVKSAMGQVESWITIDNNSQIIFSGQAVNFLLTINVPASAGD